MTKEETAEALRKGRQDKHYRLVREEYGKLLLAEPVIKRYTADELFSNLPAEVTIDEHNQEIIGLLCQYFAGDPAFEKDGRSLAKGLILFGGVGVGKTTLMRLFQRNQIASYLIFMCRAIEDEFSQVGDKALKQFGTYTHPKNISSNQFGHTVYGICFDDLGTEPLSKFYGKDTNVMAEIILNRYDNELPNTMTHLTTNLTVEEIKHRYGSRVSDRMREMFNLMEFPSGAPSRRK